MDLQQITDIEKLESLAYRQVVTIEQAQANLRALQQRIAQLSEEKPQAQLDKLRAFEDANPPKLNEEATND